jgi:hypothetical protein
MAAFDHPGPRAARAALRIRSGTGNVGGRDNLMPAVISNVRRLVPPPRLSAAFFGGPPEGQQPTAEPASPAASDARLHTLNLTRGVGISDFYTKPSIQMSYIYYYCFRPRFTTTLIISTNFEENQQTAAFNKQCFEVMIFTAGQRVEFRGQIPKNVSLAHSLALRLGSQGLFHHRKCT